MLSVTHPSLPLARDRTRRPRWHDGQQALFNKYLYTLWHSSHLASYMEARSQPCPRETSSIGKCENVWTQKKSVALWLNMTGPGIPRQKWSCSCVTSDAASMGTFPISASNVASRMHSKHDKRGDGEAPPRHIYYNVTRWVPFRFGASFLL